MNLSTDAIGVQSLVSIGIGIYGMAGGPGAIGVYGQTFSHEGSIGVAGVVDDVLIDGVTD